MKWYVVHTYSGHENKVKVAIENKVRNLGLETRVGEIRIPTYDDPYLDKKGKKRTRLKKTLPGYILIHMDLDEETWGIVKSTQGVTNFVGGFGDGKPKPLSEDEVSALLFDDAGDKTQKEHAVVGVDFSIGEHVKVTEGPFNTFTGVIEEIYPEKGRLRIKVEIFGRGTPVELDFLQVSKI
ncbi:MAG: transcription termination/antitermination protein NusG [Spirochaetota bacterium]